MVNQSPKTWTMWSVNGTKKVSKQEDEYINVRVSTMDADLEFSVSKKIRGSELFDLVCRTIGLRETWFFGLQFTSKKGYFDWIDFNRKVVAQDVRKVEDGYHFYFLVKFFPEDVSEELIQDITQHLFFLQVKQSILNMDIYCPPEASVLLASYAVQAKCGDFPDNEIEQGVLVLEDLLPQRVLDQYQMTPEMWEDRIKTWWMNNKSMTKEEAELEYLRIAQDLDMYGMHYFPIHNKKESNLWLGVGSLGINVYEKNNKLTPKASFAWSEIKHISFKEKKILELCIGSHNLYLRRRQPDTLEVQQMKARAKQDRARRLNEKCKLEAERELRALADKERDRLKQEIAILKEQIIAAQEALVRQRVGINMLLHFLQQKRSEETADLLAEKAHISEEEALVLTKRAADAEGEIQRMRITAIKNEEEKFMMERKAREAELIATRMVEESETRTREAEKLKQDLVRARHAEQLARSKLQEVIANPYSPVPFLNPYEGMQQQVYQPYPCPHPTEFRPYANPVSPDIMVAERDIKSLSAEIEKERTEYLRKSKLLQEQLTELRSEIEGLKVEERQTDFDRAYQESLQTGDDKYATLRKLLSYSLFSSVMEEEGMIIDGEEKTLSAADEKVEKFFADVDEECMKRDPWADMTEFEECLKDLNECFTEILETQDSEIVEKMKLHCMTVFVRLSQLNRMAHFRNKILSKDLAEKISSRKQNRQSLWDMDEQIRVVEYLTQSYLDFKPIFNDLGLEDDHFVSEKLTELSEKELSPEEHELFLEHLQTELKSRKKLASEISNLESKKKSLGNKTVSLKKSMQEMKPTLQSFLEATRPLMKLLGVSMEGGMEEQESLSSLPVPLFYVYQQFIAYRDTFDPLVTVSLLSDELASESKYLTEDEGEVESVCVERSEEPIDIPPTPEKPFEPLETFPKRLELRIKCEDKATIVLDVFYYLNMNILSAQCRVEIVANLPKTVSTSPDVLGESSILDNLFPGDEGDISPDSIAGIKLAHMGSPIAKEAASSVHWYLWLQRLGGLSHLTLSRKGKAPSSTATDTLNGANENSEMLSFASVVVEAMKRRVLARISLIEQIASVGENRLFCMLSSNAKKLHLNVPLELVKSFPSRIHSQMVGWSSITFEQFMQHPASIAPERFSLTSKNAWTFVAKFKCDKVILEALIYVGSTYPVDAPVFLLCCSYDKGKRFEKNKLLRSLERCVNVECVEELPAEFVNYSLVVQLKTIQVALDMIPLVGSGSVSEKYQRFARGFSRYFLCLLSPLLKRPNVFCHLQPPSFIMLLSFTNNSSKLRKVLPHSCRSNMSFFRRRNVGKSTGSHSLLLADKNVIYGLSRHKIIPGRMTDYLACYEAYRRTLESRSSSELLGSWKCIFGDQDMAVHLWKFPKGYVGVDEVTKLKLNDNKVMEDEDRFAKYCKDRNNSLMLSFSFWKAPCKRPPKHIYELRSYALRAGTMLEWANNWSKAIEYRREADQEVGGFFTQVGQLYVVNHIWAYENLEARKTIREKTWLTPGWDLNVAYTGYCRESQVGSAISTSGGQMIFFTLLLSFLLAAADIDNGSRGDELLFPPVSSLPVNIDFVLYVGAALSQQNGSLCAALYEQSLREMFGHDMSKAALFKAFFSSFVVTSAQDNVTLEHWKWMGRDLQCKMNRLSYDNASRIPTQYCTYSVWENKWADELADGLTYGFCLPSLCTASDIEGIVPKLRVYRTLNLSSPKQELMCSPGYQPYAWWQYASVHVVLALIVLLVLAMLCATVVDMRTKSLQQPSDGMPLRLLRQFSAVRSCRRLWTDGGSQSSVGCLHGIRVITMAWIMACHLVCFSQSVVNNVDELRRSYSDSFLAQYIYNGTFRVATFFIISGALFSYSMLGRTRKRCHQNELNWKFCLIAVLNRYLRLLPVYAFSVALLAGMLPHFSDFPTWYVVDPLRQCASSWWKNLLYISNLEHVQLCMPWTWYLAADFQLFVVHLPLVLLLLKKPKVASLVTAVLLICSCVVKAAIVYVRNYPPSVMLLVPIDGYNPNVANYTFDVYMKPYGWWGSYLVGMYFGYILFGLKQHNVRPLWCHLATVLGVLLNCVCLFSVYWTVQGWHSTAFDLAYVGLGPVLWGLGWALIICACHCNPKGLLNNFLSCRFWVPLSNLTYSCYLIHCVVVFAFLEPYAKSSINGPFLPTYSHLETASVFALVLLSSYVSAGFLFFLVEAPSGNIRSLLLRRWFRVGHKEESMQETSPFRANDDKMLNGGDTDQWFCAKAISLVTRGCFLSGFVVFKRVDGLIKYLLLQASDRDHHWTPPKGSLSGHLDEGETDLDAAIRETREESGLERNDYSIIPDFRHVMKYLANGKPKEVVYMLAELRNLNTKVELSHEHQKFEWCPLLEACQLVKYPETISLLQEVEAFLARGQN
ncbi:hypothetical protein M513_05516 [Trichuris suis]|uniref:Bis(5'-nucleosyl)-tetraphosphatase [asymmetrical] n=1 Tax=Trichuris suis TaxID=68888 RepID=A0A085M8Q4_9BILA|nr:hypothetical protein M513_05516 [Trichuris suis]